MRCRWTEDSFRFQSNFEGHTIPAHMQIVRSPLDQSAQVTGKALGSLAHTVAWLPGEAVSLCISVSPDM